MIDKEIVISFSNILNTKHFPLTFYATLMVMTGIGE